MFSICLLLILCTLIVSAPSLSAISSAIAWQLSYTTTIDSCFIPTKFKLRLTPLHREHLANTEKGWSSDFPPLPSAFSGKYPMAFVLRSHNGVHCCGTVGDSHSHSQLIAAKRTFTGEGRGFAPTFKLNIWGYTSMFTLQIYDFIFILQTKNQK